MSHSLPPPAYLVLKSEAGTKRVPVKGPAFTIGRDPRCSLRPADTALQPLHTVIRLHKGAFYVQDKSGGQTRLNGQPVKTARLRPGDRIQIGSRTFEFAVGVPATPTPRVLKARPKPAPAPTPDDPFAGVSGYLDASLDWLDQAPTAPAPMSFDDYSTYEIVGPQRAEPETVTYTPTPDADEDKGKREWLGRLYMAAFLVSGILALGVIVSSLIDTTPVYIPDPNDTVPANSNPDGGSRGATMLYFYADW